MHFLSLGQNLHCLDLQGCMGYAFVNSLSGTVCTLAFGSVLYILGCKVGSVIVSGTLILALTSLLAKEGFFLFAIIGVCQGSIGLSLYH